MTIKVSITTEELSRVRRILDEYKINGEIGENTERTPENEDIYGHFVKFSSKKDFNMFLQLLESQTPKVNGNSFCA